MNLLGSNQLLQWKTLLVHRPHSSEGGTLLWGGCHSVLWRCWLGSRKGIRPVKNWMMGCWHGCLGWGADLHIAQQMPLPLTISCSSKSRLVLTFLVWPFWYLLTRVVPDIFQKSSKMVVCVCVCVCHSLVGAKQLRWCYRNPHAHTTRHWHWHVIYHLLNTAVYNTPSITSVFSVLILSKAGQPQDYQSFTW